jgi:hypothetical protein
MEFIINEESRVIDELFHALAKDGIAGNALKVSHHFLTRGEVDPLKQVMGSVTSESCARESRSLYVFLGQFEQNFLK